MKVRRDNWAAPIFDDDTGYEYVIEVFDREESDFRLRVLDQAKNCILVASYTLVDEWADASRQSMNITCVLRGCYVPGNGDAPGINVAGEHPLSNMIKDFMRDFWVNVARKDNRVNFKLIDARKGK